MSAIKAISFFVSRLMGDTFTFSGSENIYPREIEDTICTHPKVVEVAVFGVPDDFYGEELVARIQLHGDEH